MQEALEQVRELNRTVRPQLAQDLILSIISSSSQTDLETHRLLIDLAIAGFHTKRENIIRKALNDRLKIRSEPSDFDKAKAPQPSAAPQRRHLDQELNQKPGPPLPSPPPLSTSKWSSEGHSERSEAEYRASRMRQRTRGGRSGGANKVKFTDIKFGFKSAEAERRKLPALLLEGFFQRHAMIDGLIHGSEFLVLGYKGSGKSSIAEHLKLESNDRSDLFVESLLLRDFPYEQVPQIVEGDADISVRTNLAWSILLLLKIFESLTKDQAISFQDGGIQFGNLTKELRSMGLLPKRKFRDLVLVSREVNLSVELAKVVKGGIVGQYKEPVVVLSHIRDALKEMIRDAMTPNRHLIIIDGLDEIFTLFSSWFETIASLVHEIDSLNSYFEEAHSAPKIILLCRADIFERLPSPNINKLRDYAYILDWYHDPRDPEDSDLFELAHHRARLAGYRGMNVLAEALPESLYLDRPRPLNTYKFLLDHTRHTPRDFLQLLHYIQRAAKDRQLVSISNVLAGLRAYSIDYFLPELKDELAGYFDPKQIEACFGIIGGLRRRDFSLADLKEYSSKSGIGAGLDLEEAVRVLFDCSALGNIVIRPRGEEEDGGVFYTFRFRNRNASVNYGERLMLHRGVWKGFNIV